MKDSLGPVSLKQVVLSLSGRCNYACRYCYAAGQKGEDMSEAVARKAVALAAGQKEKFILQFSGGEPLLNFPALQAAVGYAEEKKLDCVMQVQTNASLLTEEIALWLFRHKVGIGVSLDGRPKVNDRLRRTKKGEGTSVFTLRGLEVLRRLGIGCGLTCTVTKENVNEMEGIAELAYFLGNVRRLGFDLLRAQGRGSEVSPPSPQEAEAAIERVRRRNEELAALTGYKIELTQEEKAAKKGEWLRHCPAVRGEAVFVAADGSLYACASFIGDEKFYIGCAERGIDEKLRRQATAALQNMLTSCQRCPELAECGGGCAARWQQGAYPAECACKRAFRATL